MEQPNKPLTLGSLFDGSGGFPLGGLLAGITPVWASEVEPFAIRVTTKRLPFLKHYGDVSEMRGDRVEPVDIITFGSPCQDMSIAGKRSGLDGSRSGLFHEAIRIVKEMRCATNGKYPRYIVWENVPGAFSSNAGEDFRSVLTEICKVKNEDIALPRPEKWSGAGEILADDFSVAWRVLDAQFWGVPQRRKRIFLVADFAGGCAGKILFESEGLSRYSAEGFRSWQGAAERFEAGIAAAGFDGYNGCLTDNVAATLGVNCGMSSGRNGIVLNDQGGNRMDITNEVTCTLRAEAHHPPCVMESAGFCTEHSAKARGIGYEEETAPTLRAGVVPAAVAIENHPTDSRVKLSDDGKVQTLTSRMGTGGNNVPLLLKIRSGREGGGKGPLIQEDKSATLGCNNDQTLFEPKGYGICSKDSNSMKSANPHSGFYEADTARTLDGNGGNPACNQGGIAVVCVDQGGGKSSCSVSVEKAPTLACTHGGEPVVCINSEDAIPFTQNQRDEVRLLGDKSGAICRSASTKQQTYVLQGSMIGRKNENGPQGDGVNEDVSFTLNTADRHAVYAVTTGSYTQVTKDQAPTLMARDYKDPAVVNEPAYGIGRDTFNQGQNAKFNPSVSEEVQPTLVAKGPGAVCKPVSFYPQMKAECQTPREDICNTLVNGTNPGYQNGIIDPQYTVRRLTPTECARLQGFPDWWCRRINNESPSDEELSFWTDVFETHRKVTGGSTKPKTETQIRKWLQTPYSDSAEYKMWGNGVCLNVVYYVMCGIKWAAEQDFS